MQFSPLNAFGNVVIGSTLSTEGRIKKTTRVTGTPYAVLASDDQIFVDTDTAGINVNLPVGVDGASYRIINCGSSGNNITLAPNGAELLKGVNASMTITDGDDLNLTYETTEGWF